MDAINNNIINNNIAIFILEDESDIIYVLEHLKSILDDEGKNFLCTIIAKMTKPISVVIEESYIDKVYRDSFYNYFSSKHFDISRDCKRITFLKERLMPRCFVPRRDINS